MENSVTLQLFEYNHDFEAKKFFELFLRLLDTLTGIEPSSVLYSPFVTLLHNSDLLNWLRAV